MYRIAKLTRACSKSMRDDTSDRVVRTETMCAFAIEIAKWSKGGDVVCLQLYVFNGVCEQNGLSYAVGKHKTEPFWISALSPNRQLQVENPNPRYHL